MSKTSSSNSRKSRVESTFDLFAPFLPALVDSSEDSESDATEPDLDPPTRPKPAASADPEDRPLVASRVASSSSSTSSKTVSSSSRLRAANTPRDEASQYYTPAASVDRARGNWASPPPRQQHPSADVEQPAPRGFGGFTGFLRGLIRDSGVQKQYTEEWVQTRGKGAASDAEHVEDKSYYFGEEEEEEDNKDDEEDYATLAYGEDPDRDSPEEAGSSEDDGFAADWGIGGTKRRRNRSKDTITQAIFEKDSASGTSQVLASSDIQSDAGGIFQTAPQSLVDVVIEDIDAMAPLPSRWADDLSSSEPSLAPSPVNGVSPMLKKKKTEEPREPDAPVPEINTATCNGKELPTVESVANHLLSAPELARTPSTRSSSPNVRTTVKWQKRNVIIQIPSDVPWGLPEEMGGKPFPLTFAEVEARMQHWRDLGYNVDIISADEHQNREIYPEEKRGKVDASEIFVSIPDRRGRSPKIGGSVWVWVWVFREAGLLMMWDLLQIGRHIVRRCGKRSFVLLASLMNPLLRRRLRACEILLLW